MTRKALAARRIASPRRRGAQRATGTRHRPSASADLLKTRRGLAAHGAMLRREFPATQKNPPGQHGGESDLEPSIRGRTAHVDSEPRIHLMDGGGPKQEISPQKKASRCN